MTTASAERTPAQNLDRLVASWRLKADQHADRRDSYTAQILRECAADLALVLELVETQ